MRGGPRRPQPPLQLPVEFVGEALLFSQMFPLTLEGKNVSQVPLKNGSGDPGACCSGIQRPQAQIYTLQPGGKESVSQAIYPTWASR